MPLKLATLLLLCTLMGAVLAAADFYVDPVNGSAMGTGTSADPWLTIEQLISDDLIESRDWDTHPYTSGATLQAKNSGAPVQPGDTIWLRNGYHGELVLNGYYNSSNITIAAQAGHTPELERVSIIGAENWILDGLSISPEHAPTFTQQTIVTVRDDGFWGPCSDVIVRNCDVFCADDSSLWTAQDWIDHHSTAFDVRSGDTEIANNTVRNTRYGISISGDNCYVHDNVIDGFSGDGIRGIGDYGVFEYNVVKNAIDVGDGHHDDGFQSWSVGPGGVGTGTVYGIEIRGNTFINHENPSHPMRTTMQAIGCFDGWFEDWIIENNVVITDHWHGISLLGAKNCRIINNTVVDLYAGTPGPCWILIDYHKNGNPSEDCLVRNNLANTISVPSGQTNITVDHNITVTTPANHFVDPSSFDLHLLDTSTAIDAGSSTLAPGLDRDKFPRPYGSAHDVGAYEDHPPGANPGGGSGGGDSDGDDGSCTTSESNGLHFLVVALVAGLLAARRLTPKRSV